MTSKKTVRSRELLHRQKRKIHGSGTKGEQLIILFNKPYQVLSQFTDEAATPRRTLAQYIPLPDVYAAGRLDYDSEGLLLLTNDGELQHHISHPTRKVIKTYYVQVDGEITHEAIKKLKSGLKLKDGLTQPAQACKVDEPDWIWVREPPIRYRKSIPTSWLKLSIKEGRNRQVRRMTAAVGFPTLRLIRYAIGNWTIENLESGSYQILSQ